MWLPKPFYELLPYLYAVGGLLSAFYIQTFVGFALGFLLLLTACLIWMMRRDYRKGGINLDN
jgi:hypothetical protein